MIKHAWKNLFITYARKKQDGIDLKIYKKNWL